MQDDEQKWDSLKLVGHEEFYLVEVFDMECE
jgi:hypothetical protein